MTKAAIGYDKSRFDDPKITQNNEQYFSLREAWANVCNELFLKGYMVRPELGGKVCGHNVYVRTHQVPIRGIKTPEGFWFWRPINLLTELAGFHHTVQVACTKLIGKAEDNKAEIKRYREILHDVIDTPADTKCPVSKLAQSFYPALSEEGDKRPVTLGGTPGNYKVVPQLSWFPEDLQKLDARKLLSLYPDAEARQMMLLLGRAVVGASRTQAAEGVIEHTFRSYGITVGTEPGMGKSTLHQYIIDAMKALGYKISMVHVNDTKFGWGEVAQSDLAFIDDLTDDVQKRLLSDARIKSIVSNNQLMVEQKGQPAHGVRATSVILGCSNLYNPGHFIGMDSGSTSRVNQLDTYSSEELTRVYPDIADARTKPLWEQLARQYNVSTECLAAYLLRRSADYFLEICGYKWDSFNRLHKDNPDRLEEVVKANRSQFRLDTGLRHVEELVSAAAHTVAVGIAKADEVDREQYLGLLEHLDFSPSLLVAVLRLFSSTKAANPLPKEYDQLMLKNASWDCKKYISSKLNDLDRLNETMSAEAAFTAAVKELKSTKGFGYPTKPSQYVPLWLSLRRQIPSWVEQYRSYMKSTALPQNLKIAASEVHKIFNEM